MRDGHKIEFSIHYRVKGMSRKLCGLALNNMQQPKTIEHNISTKEN
ncbi:MAG: hypothetical protein RSB39_02015 [Oscillospiraceae bacterium]